MKIKNSFTQPRKAGRNKLGTAMRGASTLALLALTLGACATNANVENARTSQALNEGQSLTDLAWAAADRGDHFAAIPMFRRAHRGSRGAGEPLYGLGKSLMAVGQYADAIEVLQKAAQEDRTHVDARKSLGQALLIQGDFAGAVQAMRSAATLDGGQAQTLAALGVALDAFGEHEQALSNLRSAVTADPGNLDIASNLGLSLALHGEADEAVTLMETVVRNEYSNAKHRQNLAIAYAMAGDVERAIYMSSIDLDYRAVMANIGFIDMVRALPTQQRMAAILGTSGAPKRTHDGHARRGITVDDAVTRATLKRLLDDPRAQAQPVAVAEAEIEQDPVGLGGVPPLLEPTGWAVQIAAYRKIEHLAPGWAYLSEKYAHIIGGLEPRRSEVDHPASARGPVGFFYRLNAGPLTGREQAVSICAQLKAENGECWVRPPEPAEGMLPDDPAVEEEFISSNDHNAVMQKVARDVIETALPAPTAAPPATVTVADVDATYDAERLQPPLDRLPAQFTQIEDKAASPVEDVVLWSKENVDTAAHTSVPTSVTATLHEEEASSMSHEGAWSPKLIGIPLGEHLPDPVEPTPQVQALKRSTAPIEPPAALHVVAKTVVPAIPSIVSTVAAADDEDNPILVFGGAEEEVNEVATLSSETDIEVLPANFGQTGIIELGKGRKPAINVISAFEEAEQDMVETKPLNLPIQEEPLPQEREEN